MLASIAITPSAPVLVPELSGAAADEVAGIRSAALAAAATLPQRWVAIGSGDADQVIGPTARGSYAGFGADVAVSFGPESQGPVLGMPVCALWAGWLRDHAGPAATVEVRVYDRGRDTGSALKAGRDLAAELDRESDPIGVLVVADGTATLTPAAPGGFDPDSLGPQQALDDALAAADPAVLTGLASGVVGRVAYEVLAGLTNATAWSGRELYRGAPYGVGYFVGVWSPKPAVRSRPSP